MAWKGYLFIGLSAVLLVPGCGKQAPQKATIPEPNLSTPGFIIDSHIHYRAADEWEKSFLEVFENLYFDMTGSSLIKKDEDPGYWKQFLWWTPYIGKPHMPKDAVPAFQKIVFATDQSPEGLEENIIRFNKVLDACGVSEETRRKCWYETIAQIHGIDVSRYLKK